jgi:hypothetical protein
MISPCLNSAYSIFAIVESASLMVPPREEAEVAITVVNPLSG